MSVTTERPVSPTVAPAPPPGDRFVAGALFALVLVLAAYQAIAGTVIPPLMGFLLLFGITGVAVWRRGSRWRLVAAAVLAVVYLAGSVPFFAANLAHPESPVSFLAEAFLLIGLGTVLLGAVGGLRRARTRRPVAIGAVALGALAGVVSLIAAASVDADARQPGDVPIEVVRAVFPERVEVPAGPAALWIDNQDPLHHTLVVEDSDVRVILPASTAVRAEVDLAPGTHRYLCDVPGHESMVGELHVR
jgi:plastocyanin